MTRSEWIPSLDFISRRLNAMVNACVWGCNSTSQKGTHKKLSNLFRKDEAGKCLVN